MRRGAWHNSAGVLPAVTAAGMPPTAWHLTARSTLVARRIAVLFHAGSPADLSVYRSSTSPSSGVRRVRRPLPVRSARLRARRSRLPARGPLGRARSLPRARGALSAYGERAGRDIRKSAFSRNLVRPGDGWDGPVIVKSDLNCAGRPERLLREPAWVRSHAPRPRLCGISGGHRRPAFDDSRDYWSSPAAPTCRRAT